MATGALDANGIWQYGEDDSLSPYSPYMNKGQSSVSTQIAADRVSLKARATVTAATGKTANPPVGVQLIEQAGYLSVTSGASGLLPVVTFANPFPNGLIGVWMTTFGGAGQNPVINGGAASVTTFQGVIPSIGTGVSVQYSWRALGW